MTSEPFPLAADDKFCDATDVEEAEKQT